MRSLHIDIETFCEIDLRKAGAYRYAEEAEIILFAYAYDDEPTVVVDLLAGEEIPDSVMSDLTGPNVTKKAFNAAFERAVMQVYFNMKLPVEQWQCTQARTAMCGLPLNLEQSAAILKIPQQKDKGGGALIRYFCVPIKKPIKKNEFRVRNFPQHDPLKWQQFKDYNGKDVDAERAVDRALAFYHISDFEHRQWCLDQEINERGVAINIPFVRNAISLINHYENGLLQEFRDITGVDKPSELGKLKKWLFEETGEEVLKLNKETIPDILQNTDSEKIKRALEIRQDSSKTSTKKYPAMMSSLGADGRSRGLHQYYGANRTGRLSGRLWQHQNLPQGNLEAEVDAAIATVMRNDPDWLEYIYGPIPETLSSLIRSAIIPAPAHRFIISDFKSIEARVDAWLAGEEWALEVFRTHGKIYEMTAAKMFNIPLESIDKQSHYRKKGKVASLACGFGGSKGALIKMGALRDGLSEDDLLPIVREWRLANPNIVNFWYALQKAAIQALQTGEKIYVHQILIKGEYMAPNHGLAFEMKGRSLLLTLPSGRKLVYVNASIEDGEYGDRIVYWGINQTKKTWVKLDTYGGKLCENTCQAVARDLLMHGMQNMDRHGYKIVLHIHDESVSEMPIGVGSLDEVNRLMSTLPDWAAELPVGAEGEESFYYKK